MKPIRPVFLDESLLRQPASKGLHVGQAYFSESAVAADFRAMALEGASLPV